MRLVYRKSKNINILQRHCHPDPQTHLLYVGKATGAIVLTMTIALSIQFQSIQLYIYRKQIYEKFFQYCNFTNLFSTIYQLLPQILIRTLYTIQVCGLCGETSSEQNSSLHTILIQYTYLKYNNTNRRYDMADK